MNTLCLISANPGQKLKVLFSEEERGWWWWWWCVAQLAVSSVSCCDLIMLTVCHTASAEYQYQYNGDGEAEAGGDLLLHIRSEQMSPHGTGQPLHSRHTRLGYIKVNWFSREICTLRLIARDLTG